MAFRQIEIPSLGFAPEAVNKDIAIDLELLTTDYLATARDLTARAVNVAWLLNQPFPVVAIVSLPSLLAANAAQYEEASRLLLEEAIL